MRWPLRNQILLPMASLMLATLLGMSAINAYLSLRRSRSRIEHDLRQVATTLTDPQFPLTDSVLRKMKGLSGAEFVLTDAQGQVFASTASQATISGLPVPAADGADAQPVLAAPIRIGNRAFFHAPIDVARSERTGPPLVLHILYPKQAYDEAWRVAVYPPILIGVFAVVLVVLLAHGIANRVTRPLRTLQKQVDEIAAGCFVQLPVPVRDDELADLSRCISQMSRTLAQYEDQVRRSEQMRTLGLLGGGIAHQIRNSVTGCRLAVELHARQCGLGKESLDVAKTQLALMERYLQRFLALGRQDRRPHSQTDLMQVVDSVIALVGANARHCGVALTCDKHDHPIFVDGDRDALEQLFTNIVLNAIEAASRIERGPLCPREPLSKDETGSDAHVGQVAVSIGVGDERIRVEIQDTGIGPSIEIGGNVFEPFVTDKPDGTGLGLSVAREIALRHGGDIRWERRGEWTVFMVDLPRFEPEQDCVETDGH